MTEDFPKYSVLMSVYYKEKADNLKESMDSIYSQTVETDDFVLICDGPLSNEIDNVINIMRNKFGNRLHVYRLEKNQGLGNALNVGLKHCRHELIARMDSDDISRPDRCERQLESFMEHKEYSIVSGTVEEFSTDISNVESIRILEENQNDILVFAKNRNPFNHPCVMYKKTAVQAAGGYQDFYLLEDYYLWVRMLSMGCIGHNLKTPLLWMRTGTNLLKRRGGLKYAKSEQKLFIYMKRIGFISASECFIQITARFLMSIIPTRLRGIIYKKWLRKEIK
jgi:glycosyltransferase involved in cell wall biosynthesis